MDNLNYGHYQELVQSGFAYLHGEISIGIFEETVNRILSYVRDGVGQFKAIELPEELKAPVREDFTKAEDGFALLEEGITKVRNFVDSKDKEILWKGLSLMKVGCDLLNEVMRNQEKRLREFGGEN